MIAVGTSDVVISKMAPRTRSQLRHFRARGWVGVMIVRVAFRPASPVITFAGILGK
jgi:hypothetical protein